MDDEHLLDRAARAAGPELGVDYARALFGEHAVHVPAWLYVQHMGPGLVAFVGASRVAADPHPLRYGSDRTHQFVIGEIVVRPHTVHATDALRGHGLAGLAMGHEHETALAGDLILGRPGEIR